MIVDEYDEKEFFDKSIKMLEKDYGNIFANEFKDIYIKQQQEIERLTNIINELEKDIRNQRELSLPISEYSVGICDVLIHRLNLLKGSGSNE